MNFVSADKHTGVRWFCVVKLNEGVKLKTLDLSVAQKALQHGNWGNSQAIIPMKNSEAQDPHTLQKNWGTGSMYWQDWNEIRPMQRMCEQQGLFLCYRGLVIRLCYKININPTFIGF